MSMEGNSENMEEYKEANKIELYFLVCGSGPGIKDLLGLENTIQ